jgi:hypothetical protein
MMHTEIPVLSHALITRPASDTIEALENFGNAIGTRELEA